MAWKAVKVPVPTSTKGTSDIALKACKMGRHQGFTLIEIMVVVTIIGIMTGLIALSVSTSNPQKDLDREALKFKTLIEMAQEEALFSQQEIGVIVDEHGYRFASWGIPVLLPDPDAKDKPEDEADLNVSDETISTLGTVTADQDDLPMPVWNMMGADPTFRARDMDEDYEIVLEVEHEQIDLTGGTEEQRKKEKAKLASKILEDEDEEIKPSIFILSSGEISPFVMEIFHAEDRDLTVKISANEAGKVWIGDEEDEEYGD